MKTTWAALASLVLTLIFTSPEVAAAPSPSPRGPTGKLFRFRLPFETSTLDWNLGDIPIMVIQNVMRGLYRVDDSGKVVPDLIDQVTTKDDGKLWVFRLKPGIKWSDGVALDAAHVVASLRRLIDPKVGSSYSYFLSGVSAEGIKPTSELGFEIKLESGTPYLPALLTHWVTFPIRPDLIAKYKDHWRNPEHLATLGPFRIKEWKHGARIVMVPNPHSQVKPWFERAEGIIVPDDDTALNLYEAGRLEFMTDPGQGALRHRDLVHKPSPISYFVGIGAGHPLTSTRAGIMALSAALNRTEIPKALDAPHRVTLDFCPPEIWRQLGALPQDSRPSEIPLEGSIRMAKDFLKEAGVTAPKEVPPIQLRYFNRPAIRTLAEWIQGQWKKNLGLTVTLDGQDPKTYWSTLSKKPAQFFLNSKGASYPDPDAFFKLFASKNPQNLGRWANAEYDGWVDEASRNASENERRKTYVKASRRVLDEKPALIPLYFRSTQYLMKPYLKGVSINPLTSVDITAAFYLY